MIDRTVRPRLLAALLVWRPGPERVVYVERQRPARLPAPPLGEQQPPAERSSIASSQPSPCSAATLDR